MSDEPTRSSDESRPLEACLPPEIQATPADLRPRPDEPLTWWRPGWHDVAGHVGYRWIFLLPAAVLILMLAGSFFVPAFGLALLVVGFKLLIFAGAVAISLAGYVVRRAVKARREPFCIHCGYNLSGLPDNYRCPECGQPYTWRLIAEYRRDPQWFIERYKATQKLPPAGPALTVERSARSAARRCRRDGT
jgi:predicted RNA-binding Zn-ribbon protein involved in translation (DUF1610 family)